MTGRRSPAGLYDYGLATYDTGDVFDQTLAKGFVELWGLPTKIAAERDRRLPRRRRPGPQASSLRATPYRDCRLRDRGWCRGESAERIVLRYSLSGSWIGAAAGGVA